MSWGVMECKRINASLNNQFRVCFRWSAAGAEDVEIVDYH